MVAICLTASMAMAVRCPLTTFLTFTKKNSVEKKETKQKRQEKERSHARRERQGLLSLYKTPNCSCKELLFFREERVVRLQRGLGHNDLRPELPEHIRAKLYKRLAEEEDVPAVVIV